MRDPSSFPPPSHLCDSALLHCLLHTASNRVIEAAHGNPFLANDYHYLEEVWLHACFPLVDILTKRRI